MSKFIKVAYWEDMDKTGYARDIRLTYINIDMIYKIHAYQQNMYNIIYFNFLKFYHEDMMEGISVHRIDEPTVILTKKDETFYHPLPLDKFLEENNIEITDRFELLDF